MKKFFSIFAILFGFLIFIHQNVYAAVTTQVINGVSWQVVQNGNDLNSVISSATSGSTLNILAANNITATNGCSLPTNLTLTFDLGGNALYFDNGLKTYYTLSNGDHVTLQNENQVATGTTNSFTGTNAAGTAQSTIYYASAGIFGTSGSTPTGASLTYKNVVQDLRTITSWANAGMAFSTMGMQVQFSGQNLLYYNYDSAYYLDFMQGNGFNVLDGKTQILGGDKSFNSSLVNATQSGSTNATGGIDVAVGAELDINWSSTNQKGYFYISNGKPGTTAVTDFHIRNNGTLNMTLSGATSNTTSIFGANTISGPITYAFGPNSNTLITASGLFNMSATSGSFSTSVGSDANFTYNAGASTIFTGTLGSSDKFTINSANNVRFNTTLSTSTSIFGTDSTIMPINLQLDPSDVFGTGFSINGYNSSGTSVLSATTTTGAYNVLGTFHSSLSDLSKLTGNKVPTSTEITTYQSAAQLEFVKMNAELAFNQIPTDSSMIFNSVIQGSLANGIIPRVAGTASNMSFRITDTYGSPSFSVQATVTNSTLPSTMSFVWGSVSTPTTNLTLGTSASTIFNSNSSGVSSDGAGNFALTFANNSGLLIQSNSSRVSPGTYTAQINWTLVSGIQ